MFNNLFTPSKPRNTHVPSESSPYLPHPSHTSLVTNHHPTDHGSDHTSLHAIPQPPALIYPPASTCSSPSNLLPLVTQELQPTRPARSTSKLSDWFSGESEPIPFAIIPSPTKEKLDPVGEMTSSQPKHIPATSLKLSAARDTPKPPIISRFSLFATKQSSSKAPIAPADVHDEWHDLDVKTVLFPSGPADPFSPSAFKNLQQNAEGLLSKLHAAYKQRSQALHDVLAEKEAQAEENEGAEMRAKHLKLQLNDMTAKLAEQDKAMMDLVDQLAQEKQARREVEANRRRDYADTQHNPNSSKNRTSTASDISLESEDSCAESLFSRHGATSPTMSMSSVSTMNSPESASLHQLPPSTDRYHPQNAPNSARSRCQGAETKTSDNAFCSPQSQCVNCDGLKDSEAWSLVNILKLENKGLKTRLGQLESTVDDCLDMLKGLF
ncbi:MAG: hypothetical protein Q9166_005394 [cf. Caloplaca sp. 2 TL-2023]